MKFIFLEQGKSVLRDRNWESAYWKNHYMGKYCIPEDAIMEKL